MPSNCNPNDCAANSREIFDRIGGVERDVQQLRSDREEDNRMLTAERHKMKDVLQGLSVATSKLVILLEGTMGSTGLVGAQKATDERLDSLEKWQVEKKPMDRMLILFAGFIGGISGPIVSKLSEYVFPALAGTVVGVIQLCGELY